MTADALAVLVGRWEIVGRSIGADHDDIHGQTTVEPILGGGVLRLATTMGVGDHTVESLELVWPDPDGDTFSAHVYSCPGPPLLYRWERRGARLLHAGAGATYLGTVSDDGTTITGGWRPDVGQPAHPGSAYDATMHRIDAVHHPERSRS